jgi:hypothetical protein
MAPITLATEDELSEAIVLRILAAFSAITIGACLRRGGNGYLRSRIRNLCEMARRQGPVLVVTDLDTSVCPAKLREDWLGRTPQPPGLLLRVAVREVESWLLADHDAVATLLRRSARQRLPDIPDRLPDPKDFLLNLARHAPKDVRLDLRAETGAMARQGLGYNARLCHLVRTEWQPDRAAERSPSLRRAIERIRDLASPKTTT